MDRVKTLEIKIRAILAKLQEHIDDKNKLTAEKKFLEEENEKLKSQLKEADRFNEEKKSITAKIEKIIKKINNVKAG
jgi:hypothetical protein